MKTMYRILAVALVVAFALAPAWASGKMTREEAAKLGFNVDLIEENLLIGLNSDNLGLRESAACMLGEFGSSKAVAPLMAMLHNGPESSRIVAALALTQIGDPIGTYAVRQAVKFDDSPRVQQLCAWYYAQYVEPGSFEFIALQPTDEIEYAVNPLMVTPIPE